MNEPSAVAKKNARKVVDGQLTYTERSAAKRLGVSYMTLFRMRRAGQIGFFRVGSRVLYDDRCLTEFLERHRRQAA
jgi:excisionase family DNA binding protein